MKILFVNQFYAPERVATAQILSDLCVQLAAAGHEVHVLASRQRFDEGGKSTQPLPSHETLGGVHVTRVGGTGYGKRGLLRQLFDFLSFHVFAGANLLLGAKRFDLIVTLTTPPLLGLHGTMAKLLTRVPHITWVMNLHPDCAIELGMMDRRKWFVRLLNELSSQSLRRADRCVALGRCMADRLVNKGVKERNVRLIPLWGHDFAPEAAGADSDALRQRWELAGKFVVLYSGNAGLEYTFEEICAAALKLRDDPRFVFVFTGGGRRTEELHLFRRAHGLQNMQIHAYVERKHLPELLTLGDVHLASLRPNLSGVSVPCKLYGIMSAARPIVFIGPPQCETALTISETGCGRVVPYGDADALVAALKELEADPAQRQRLGNAGREAFQRQYNVGRGCEAWKQLMSEFSGETAPVA